MIVSKTQEGRTKSFLDQPTYLEGKPKGENSMLGKRRSSEPQRLGQERKVWMIWVKLNCLKSSDKSVLSSLIGKWLKPMPNVNNSWTPSCQSPTLGTGPMRSIKSRTDTLSHPNNVTMYRITGWPTGREPHGHGALVVVVGVTPHQGGRESRPQGEGEQVVSGT